MAFEKSIHLDDCKYTYTISPKIKKYTLRDTTFEPNKLGHYELNRLLEEVPNSGQGFPVKITIHKDLSSFKLSITDQSGLRLVNIFKSDKTAIIQDKFYFLMDSLVERDIFTKTENDSPNL
ncbi:DUF1831 domain-containing protein [Streptococcus tangpeifui]|uniref:Cysteine desulfurase n=1 Tax=Streptococcus criceti HS-6 TaxID=873449 RepID=G5JN36_STRCG|nr:MULTISPECIES: DUF1831 domain-containing protein [Streptococcus]EHI74302.1 hypothetical protein STRCR_1371 [Streptococcus criceti HS-6]SUN38918.1 Domain of uncharacterised function (DUF1831) [Streptococcus criceti]